MHTKMKKGVMCKKARQMPRRSSRGYALVIRNERFCGRLSESEIVKKGSECMLLADPTAPVYSRSFKMSKSRGNVINPDDIVYQYGADSLRLYEMFMGPLTDTKVAFRISR